MTTEENIENIALAVRELTGDWVNTISCEDILAPERYHYDQIVYFGQPSDLEEGGKAFNLNWASMMDRYTFDEQRVGFFYNSDKECKEKKGLDKDKDFVVYFNGEYAIPYVIEASDEGLNKDRLLYETTVRVVNGSPRWSSRANSAMYDFYANGLIYMYP